jgi:Tfp pilus assembly protein PilN
MATTLRPPERAASAERAPRPLLIAANLLPVEIVESRRGRKVKRIVLCALVGFVALLAAWYALASYQTSTARSSLRGVQDDAQRLVAQQHAFDEVVGIQAESRAISTALSFLLADDLQWSRLLSSLQKAAPKDVPLTSVSGALRSSTTTTTTTTTTTSSGASGSGSSAAAAQLPGTSGEESIGTLTITGSGNSKATVAAYVDALGKVPGLGNPLLGDATLQNGALQFTVRVDITASALGGRYTASGNRSGGD